MAFIRTGMIIVSLLLGWAAVRSQTDAHIMPIQITIGNTTTTHTAS